MDFREVSLHFAILANKFNWEQENC